MMTKSPRPTTAIGVNMAGEVFSPLSKVSELTSSSIGADDFSSSIISDAGISLLTCDDDEYFVKTKDCHPSSSSSSLSSSLSSSSFRRKGISARRRRQRRHNNNANVNINKDQRWSALDRSLFCLSSSQRQEQQQEKRQQQGQP